MRVRFSSMPVVGFVEREPQVSECVNLTERIRARKDNVSEIWDLVSSALETSGAGGGRGTPGGPKFWRMINDEFPPNQTLASAAASMIFLNRSWDPTDYVQSLEDAPPLPEALGLISESFLDQARNFSLAFAQEGEVMEWAKKNLPDEILTGAGACMGQVWGRMEDLQKSSLDHLSTISRRLAESSGQVWEETGQLFGQVGAAFGALHLAKRASGLKEWISTRFRPRSHTETSTPPTWLSMRDDYFSSSPRRYDDYVSSGPRKYDGGGGMTGGANFRQPMTVPRVYVG